MRLSSARSISAYILHTPKREKCVTACSGDCGGGCIPGPLEMPAGTTRTGGVSAFPDQLELDRFKEAAGVGMGVGGKWLTAAQDYGTL